MQPLQQGKTRVNNIQDKIQYMVTSYYTTLHSGKYIMYWITVDLSSIQVPWLCKGQWYHYHMINMCTVTWVAMLQNPLKIVNCWCSHWLDYVFRQASWYNDWGYIHTRLNKNKNKIASAPAFNLSCCSVFNAHIIVLLCAPLLSTDSVSHLFVEIWFQVKHLK